MQQIDAIHLLARSAQSAKALVISEIGSQTTWLHETGDHDSYLYLSGPMGLAPSVALGVALSMPERPVLALCGDGALAMNFSSLVTLSDQAPANLTLALMDNGVYDFTGKLASPSRAIDWEKAIAGLPGFQRFERLSDESPPVFSATAGLGFIHATVLPAARKPRPFPFSGPEIYRRFLAYTRAARQA